MARPFISVLIDTYNHERFIEQAIASVVEQDVGDSEREIIVVDDGSVDRTPEIVRKFEPRVQVLRKANGGQASAFNAGIPECRGEIIAFLDGDDWWAPGKLRAAANALSADTAVGLVGHGITEVYSNGATNVVAPEKTERLRLDSLAAARVFRLRKSYFGTSRMALRSALARQILPVPEDLVIEADEYLFTLAALLSDAIILVKPLTYYCIHGDNLYVAAGREREGLRRKQRVTAALAKSLQEQMMLRGGRPEVVHCVIEVLQAEADQMRLMLDGGAPWETIRVESKLYGIMHADAPTGHRVFRSLGMAIAALLPPRWFYAGRQWIGSRIWYRRVREKIVPVPHITRIASADDFRA